MDSETAFEILKAHKVGHDATEKKNNIYIQANKMIHEVNNHIIAEGNSPTATTRKL